jgi:arginyl-tRNA synthetase
LRKAQEKGYDPSGWADSSLQLTEPTELALALHLVRFEEMLHQSMQEYTPNLITEYLYELAKLFSSFYDQCSVLSASNANEVTSRLKLSSVVAKTLRVGLELLGIGVVERM